MYGCAYLGLLLKLYKDKVVMTDIIDYEGFYFVVNIIPSISWDPIKKSDGLDIVTFNDLVIGRFEMDM